MAPDYTLSNMAGAILNFFFASSLQCGRSHFQSKTPLFLQFTVVGCSFEHGCQPGLLFLPGANNSVLVSVEIGSSPQDPSESSRKLPSFVYVVFCFSSFSVVSSFPLSSLSIPRDPLFFFFFFTKLLFSRYLGSKTWRDCIL